MILAVAVLFDALVPFAGMLAEGYMSGSMETFVEGQVFQYSFDSSLADVCLASVLRACALLPLVRQKRPLAVAYPAFRVLTVLQTVLVALKLAALQEVPSVPLAQGCLVLSLLSCWAASVLPYVQSCEEPWRDAHAPLLGVCAICLDAQPDAQWRSCGHLFHAQCVEAWARAHRTCPVCRRP